MSELTVGWENLNPLVSYANRLACTPGFTFGPRIIHDHQLIWVADGLGEAVIQGRHYIASKGDLFHYGPNVIHQFKADTTRPFIVYGLHFQLIGNIPEQGEISYTLPISVAEHEEKELLVPNKLTIGQNSNSDMFSLPEHIRFTGNHAESYFSQISHSFQKSEPRHHLQNRALLLQLLLELFQLTRLQSEERSENGLLLRGLRELLKERAAMSYDRAWLREWIPYHENHTASLFQKQYSVSPHEYFRMCKLDLAKKQLIETNKSISEIADLLAFGSIHYFSRLFKSQTGYSPLVFRRLARLI